MEPIGCICEFVSNWMDDFEHEWAAISSRHSKANVSNICGSEINMILAIIMDYGITDETYSICICSRDPLSVSI